MTTVLLGFAAGELSGAQIGQIRELMPNARLVITNEIAEIEPELGDIEVAAGFFPASLIARAPKLAAHVQEVVRARLADTAQAQKGDIALDEIAQATQTDDEGGVVV